MAATGKGFSISPLPRIRWNVVDLITIVGREAARAYLFFDMDMSWAVRLRQRFVDQGDHVTFTAIFLKAIAIAQKAHPMSRQGYLPFNRRVTFNDISAGFTVERCIESQPAVFFGVIEKPDEKSLEQIASELRHYALDPIAEVARLKRDLHFTALPPLLRRLVFNLGMQLPAARLAVNPATFGVSNLGKFGAFAALGPCVCACTFGIGTVEDRAVVREGNVVVRPMTTVALSFDSRILDAGPAASFMQDIQQLVEGGLPEYRAIQQDRPAKALISATASTAAVATSPVVPS